ncbi:uncharacterized protein PV07_10849 [Cladophialophora immunda]|uniref:MmgE/PrpD family protein n=1 Tax=Cladophialophora immunda TaxID=569365 RepID=A0A0D2BU49_9EURO|nr:uncharacterized protein PV07_10849 [Cladophialophora immunda]KIW22563.1 hypothetical protein PV07_10849 [Cladophialophora immunda]OQV02352.1 hypothetical protein CLAIMM_07566 isoform 1 [Cladophialophora immunda]OQV02353.1 hypothetical protein CLAIMM_07566 isoform 2 [Cladophialophora immunda]
MAVVDHTAKLARFLSQLDYEDLPEQVVEQAKRGILNSLGCGLGSSQVSSTQKVLGLIKQADQASLLGRVERASVEDAALLNGIALTAADYDDTHLRTVIHPSGTPLAALFSWAEHHHLSGKEFLLAFVCGVEAQCAVGNAISPGHYRDGWHITGTTGSFGAAASVAKGLKLEPQRYAAALGHACSMAAGIRAMFGTDTKTLHMGRAAQNGILAANLASHGFESCTRSIESWAKLVSSTVDEQLISTLTQDKKWQILENTFKPYPCGIVIHPLIDGCLEAFSDDRAIAEKLEEVDVVVNPQCVRLCSIKHPQSGLETIFSLYHGCAVALVYGHAGPTQFSDQTCNDVAIASVRDKIKVTTDEAIRDDEAHLTFTYRGEYQKKIYVKHATGSLAKPMTKLSLEEKFLDQAVPILGQQIAQKAIEASWGLEKVEDMADFACLFSQVHRS